MLAGLGVPKQSLLSIRLITLTLISSLLLNVLGAYAYRVRMPFKDEIELSQSVVPLLLNSGVMQSKEAEVSIILWFENENVPPQILAEQPVQGWQWVYKERQTSSGKVAATISGHHRLNRIEEQQLYTWYTNINHQLEKTGGRLYIDERVSQALDISAFLSQTDASPVQWSLSGNLISIAGYQNKLKTSVMAGQDRINIQLLSRGTSTNGQTVLAIPVLLEEF